MPTTRTPNPLNQPIGTTTLGEALLFEGLVRTALVLLRIGLGGWTRTSRIRSPKSRYGTRRDIMITMIQDMFQMRRDKPAIRPASLKHLHLIIYRHRQFGANLPAPVFPENAGYARLVGSSNGGFSTGQDVQPRGRDTFITQAGTFDSSRTSGGETASFMHVQLVAFCTSSAARAPCLQLLCPSICV